MLQFMSKVWSCILFEELCQQAWTLSCQHMTKLSKLFVLIPASCHSCPRFDRLVQAREIRRAPRFCILNTSQRKNKIVLGTKSTVWKGHIRIYMILSYIIYIKCVLNTTHCIYCRYLQTFLPSRVRLQPKDIGRSDDIASSSKGCDG